MEFVQAALARPAEGLGVDVQPWPAGQRGGLSLASVGSSRGRARAGAAELVLLHRLRASRAGPAGVRVPEEAARVIELTANAWL
ncbi:MAG: hypothetical protein WCK08_19400 [Betaproteobacteria bacterium]